MTKTVKIGGSYSGKISTGPYENANPGFFVEEVLDNCILTDDEIFTRQHELQQKSYENFKRAEEQAIIERINKERQDFRWYKLPSGKKVPSVTSILNFDADYAIPPQELNQYAAWGILSHGRISHYWRSKKWVNPWELEGFWAEYVIVKKGSLALDFTCIDFPAYLEKYPFVCTGFDFPIYNEEHAYAGTLDYLGIPKASKDWKAVPTIVDAKRTPEKTKNFMQIAAYAKGTPLNSLRALSKEDWPPFEQMMILPLQNKTDQGFSKPIVSTEIDKHFDLFLEKRKRFRQRYGV